MPGFSCFRPIVLNHDFSAYNGAICRGTVVSIPSPLPEENPIMALVEATLMFFATGGITQAEMIAFVEELHPGTFTTDELEVAFAQALSQGVFISLVPTQRFQCCEETCPDAFYTFSPYMDSHSSNYAYVAYLFWYVTASLERKKLLYYRFFAPSSCQGTSSQNGGMIVSACPGCPSALSSSVFSSPSC